MESVLPRGVISRMAAVAALCLSCSGDDDPSTTASHETSTASSTKTSTGTSGGGTKGTESASSGTASTSTADSETDSTTETVEPCSRVHEGDLYVLDDSDLEGLADLGRVSGVLFIALKEREQPDLSFLSCLHTADIGLSIDYNNRLESTGGMINLSSVKNLTISNNDNLRAIEGFDKIKELGYLEIDQNPMLEVVGLGALESVDTLIIGHCEGNTSAAYQPALADLDGFSSLASVKWLILEGNEALLSAGFLDSLIENGEGESLEAAVIRRNPLLPESDILQKLDLLGVQGTVCGNAEGDPECFCFVG